MAPGRLASLQIYGTQRKTWGGRPAYNTEAVNSIDTLQETPDIETASEAYARRFAGEAGRYFLETQESAVRSVLADLPFESVLDVGGGHGQLVRLFLEQARELTVFGSDENAHRRVRESFPHAAIRFGTGNVLRLPYSDCSFDVVVAVRLISHIAAWQALLAELCRVARKCVIVDYPSWYSLNSLTPLLFRLKRSLEGNTRTYTSFVRSSLEQEFSRNGFGATRCEKQFFLPMLLHRALNGARWLQACEGGFRAVGFTALLGSPVIIRADRTTGDQAPTAAAERP